MYNYTLNYVKLSIMVNVFNLIVLSGALLGRSNCVDKAYNAQKKKTMENVILVVS